MKAAPLIAVLLAAASLPETRAQNAIYADFTVMDGSSPKYFTICLDHLNSPQAVANFIGLATGSRPWIDSQTGEVRDDPFFDGLDIHFVAFDTIVAFGSRTGDGTDNPGYRFPDDPRSVSNATFSVYMDNDGPNTNGSRLFVSLLSGAQFNANYTRLGIVDGSIPTNPPGQSSQNNVRDFSRVAADEGVPVTPLTISSVSVRKLGTPGSAAVNFNEHLWDLPDVTPADYRIVHDGSTWRLRWSDTPGSAGTFTSSVDLVTWFPLVTAFDPPGSLTLGADIGANVASVPRAFYRGAAASYPEWPSAGIPFSNALLQFNYQDPDTFQNIIQRLAFDVDGTAGAWDRRLAGATQPFQTGTFTNAAYSTLGPFRGRLTFDNGTPSYPHSAFIMEFDYENLLRVSTSRFSGIEFDDAMPEPNTRLFDGPGTSWMALP